MRRTVLAGRVRNGAVGGQFGRRPSAKSKSACRNVYRPRVAAVTLLDSYAGVVFHNRGSQWFAHSCTTVTEGVFDREAEDYGAANTERTLEAIRVGIAISGGGAFASCLSPAAGREPTPGDGEEAGENEDLNEEIGMGEINITTLIRTAQRRADAPVQALATAASGRSRRADAHIR